MNIEITEMNTVPVLEYKSPYELPQNFVLGVEGLNRQKYRGDYAFENYTYWRSDYMSGRLEGYSAVIPGTIVNVAYWNGILVGHVAGYPKNRGSELWQKITEIHGEKAITVFRLPNKEGETLRDTLEDALGSVVIEPVRTEIKRPGVQI